MAVWLRADMLGGSTLALALRARSVRGRQQWLSLSSTNPFRAGDGAL
jgi:hypothetical protein